MTSELDRYDRVISSDGADSLSEIARLIEPGSVVLDLGASTGELGRYLRAQKGCTVDGVEVEPAMATIARPHYRTLFELDLETGTLADRFPRASYDAIVCADVLEHLRNPGRVLGQLQALLTPAGRVLISLPNIGYAGVVAGLLAGEFKYRPVGLLDSTHLRFFTRSSLLELLAENGFHARSIRPLYADVSRTEFRDRHLDALPPALLRGLLAQPDALAYQFIVEAVPGEVGALAHADAPPPRFGVQLYWGLDGHFDEDRSVRAAGVMGAERQSIELAIPPLGTAPSGLRLDVADRPGYLRLGAISVRVRDGDLLWSWDGRPDSLPKRSQLTVFSDLWMASGDDPSLELPLPPPALARLANGGTVGLEIDWPMSGDFRFARELLDDRERSWGAERALLARRLEAVDTAAKHQAGEIAATVQQTISELKEMRAELQQTRSELREMRVGLLRRALRGLRNRVKILRRQTYVLFERLGVFHRAPRLRRLLGPGAAEAASRHE
ncbi:MAG TPA: class I SAM-dependent methyltransferase [Myxococcales bacterium]|jgi:O-antigen biosynthesis protein|nr:class I SAM-dependent methyltransferase [Myxococcales bacterium]